MMSSFSSSLLKGALLFSGKETVQIELGSIDNLVLACDISQGFSEQFTES
mgnify:CR=1 FL=1